MKEQETVDVLKKIELIQNRSKLNLLKVLLFTPVSVLILTLYFFNIISGIHLVVAVCACFLFEKLSSASRSKKMGSTGVEAPFVYEPTTELDVFICVMRAIYCKADKIHFGKLKSGQNIDSVNLGQTRLEFEERLQEVLVANNIEADRIHPEAGPHVELWQWGKEGWYHGTDVHIDNLRHMVNYLFSKGTYKSKDQTRMIFNLDCFSTLISAKKMAKELLGVDDFSAYLSMTDYGQFYIKFEHVHYAEHGVTPFRKPLIYWHKYKAQIDLILKNDRRRLAVMTAIAIVIVIMSASIYMLISFMSILAVYYLSMIAEADSPSTEINELDDEDICEHYRWPALVVLEEIGLWSDVENDRIVFGRPKDAPQYTREHAHQHNADKVLLQSEANRYTRKIGLKIKSERPVYRLEVDVWSRKGREWVYNTTREWYEIQEMVNLFNNVIGRETFADGQIYFTMADLPMEDATKGLFSNMSGLIDFKAVFSISEEGQYYIQLLERQYDMDTIDKKPLNIPTHPTDSTVG
ncbi:hypothetical protein JYT61_00280 [bacterium AH-315-E10]|nr:hypothetical protein [bacterium AH-315-E10]